MVDPQICREWISANPDARQVLTLADKVQKLLAASVLACWEDAVVLNRRREAGIYVAIWYRCATDLLDHLRELSNETPDVTKPYPSEIESLLKIVRND